MHIHSRTSKIGILKKLVLSSVLLSTISACVNNIPEDSDIQKALKLAFQSCERTHISGVKKINGMEGEKKNEYEVSFQFDLEVEPSEEAMARLEAYTVYRAELKRSSDELQEGLKALEKIKEESKDFTQKAYDAEFQSMMAANVGLGRAGREAAEYSASIVASRAVDDYFRLLHSEGKISKPTMGEMQRELEKAKDVKDAKASQNGYPAMQYLEEFYSDICRSEHMPLVESSFREMVKGARKRDFSTEYVTGGKITMKATGTMSKTENGWVF